ncbi:hypothetical protein D3C84_1237770 [compost metagenome]
MLYLFEEIPNNRRPFYRNCSFLLSVFDYVRQLFTLVAISPLGLRVLSFIWKIMLILIDGMLFLVRFI